MTTYIHEYCERMVDHDGFTDCAATFYVQVDYENDSAPILYSYTTHDIDADGWQSTPYQTADARRPEPYLGELVSFYAANQSGDDYADEVAFINNREAGL
mgnify:CR=1 FL=1